MNKTDKFSKEQELEIIKLYTEDKLTTRQIGKIYNCVHRTIIKCLTRNQVQTRDALNCRIGSGYDREYFKKIDTEEKAYFLGLLYADGCNNQGKAFSIGLQEEDSYLIDKLKIALKAEKIKTYTRKPQKTHHKVMKILRIMSKNICSDLNKLGLVPKKSLILKFPSPDQVSPDLIHHFVRGYFDGDGCISWNKDKPKAPVVTITGSDIFCETLNKIISQFGVKCTVTKRFEKITCTTLMLGGSLKVNRFYKFIYKDASIFMTRKKEKFEDLFKYHNIASDGTKRGMGQSKYRGVHIRQYTRKGKFYKYINVVIKKDNQAFRMNNFNSELEAAKAYDKKCYELYGEKANLNFPEDYNTTINQINNNTISIKY